MKELGPSRRAASWPGSSGRSRRDGAILAGRTPKQTRPATEVHLRREAWLEKLSRQLALESGCHRADNAVSVSLAGPWAVDAAAGPHRWCFGGA